MQCQEDGRDTIETDQSTRRHGEEREQEKCRLSADFGGRMILPVAGVMEINYSFDFSFGLIEGS